MPLLSTALYGAGKPRLKGEGPSGPALLIAVVHILA